MQNIRRVLSALAFLATSTGQALAQTAPEPAVAPVAAAATMRIPAGTIVQVELTEALSSQTSQQEQIFGLLLAEPIIVDGREVVPAGAIGGGEVIDAHRSAFGGRPGRLIISGRFIEIGGQRARIRGMQITAAGADRVNAALGVSMIPYAGVAAIFIQGGAVEIPAGARGTALLAADIEIALESSTAAADSTTAAASAEQPAAGENQ